MQTKIIRRSQLGDDWTARAHVDPVPMPPPSGDPTPLPPPVLPPIVVADERWQYEHVEAPDEVPSVRPAEPLRQPRAQAAPRRLSVPWWSWK